MNLDEIRAKEQDSPYKEEALMWWRMYIRNVLMVKNLRRQNRALRKLLSDYME